MVKEVSGCKVWEAVQVLEGQVLRCKDLGNVAWSSVFGGCIHLRTLAARVRVKAFVSCRALQRVLKKEVL